MANRISANDLKIKGISAIDELGEAEGGVVITVRGKEKYVVLPLHEYNALREYELEQAIRESLADVEDGRSMTGTVDEHLQRLLHV